MLAAGAVTAWIVASLVGPGIFRMHLHQAGVHTTSSETTHVEEAFASAMLVSIGVALAAAFIVALAVSFFLARRVYSSVRGVEQAAIAVAHGQYAVRVPDPGLGDDFARLSTSINTLAARLDSVETTRRRMLADLAHEMRNPLASLDAYVEAVEDGVRPMDPQTIGVMRASTQRLRRLAEDIAAVSSAEEGTLAISRAALVPAQIARAAARSAAEKYRSKRVHLQTGTDARRMFWGDADRMAQILGNLLDNALRHTPPGGTVRLACRDDPGRVIFEVVDSGDGIAPEDLERVFNRFYRVDTARTRADGGSGIGLTITKALVEAQGGTISARSDGVGRGAVFEVSMVAPS